MEINYWVFTESSIEIIIYLINSISWHPEISNNNHDLSKRRKASLAFFPSHNRITTKQPICEVMTASISHNRFLYSPMNASREKSSWTSATLFRSARRSLIVNSLNRPISRYILFDATLRRGKSARTIIAVVLHRGQLAHESLSRLQQCATPPFARRARHPIGRIPKIYCANLHRLRQARALRKKRFRVLLAVLYDWLSCCTHRRRDDGQ